jgi:hypothetical protein
MVSTTVYHLTRLYAFFFLLTFPKWVAERKQEGPTTRSRWKMALVKWIGGAAEVGGGDAPY